MERIYSEPYGQDSDDFITSQTLGISLVELFETTFFEFPKSVVSNLYGIDIEVADEILSQIGVSTSEPVSIRTLEKVMLFMYMTDRAKFEIEKNGLIGLRVPRDLAAEIPSRVNSSNTAARIGKIVTGTKEYLHMWKDTLDNMIVMNNPSFRSMKLSSIMMCVTSTIFRTDYSGLEPFILESRLRSQGQRISMNKADIYSVMDCMRLYIYYNHPGDRKEIKLAISGSSTKRKKWVQKLPFPLPNLDMRKGAARQFLTALQL